MRETLWFSGPQVLTTAPESPRLQASPVRRVFQNSLCSSIGKSIYGSSCFSARAKEIVPQAKLYLVNAQRINTESGTVRQTGVSKL